LLPLLFDVSLKGEWRQQEDLAGGITKIDSQPPIDEFRRSQPDLSPGSSSWDMRTMTCG
jgi:hypothetical protein